MSKNGEIYTAGKNFTVPPALRAVTNSTSKFHKFLLIDDVIMFAEEDVIFY